MKKITFSLIFAIATGFVLYSQTPGKLDVSVSTSSTGGNYAPRNILAIWIENEEGSFIKTLLAYADKRKTHLNIWQASTAAAGSEYNVVDAITGATKSSHATRTCSWNGFDYKGSAVPDGNYFLKMELTDKNSTGNSASFLFAKADSASIQSPSDNPSFSSVSLSWTPSSTVNITENRNIGGYLVYPNPGRGFYTVTGENIRKVEIRTIKGEIIYKSNTPEIDISENKNGIYLLYIFSNEKTIIKKIIKN